MHCCRHSFFFCFPQAPKRDRRQIVRLQSTTTTIQYFFVLDLARSAYEAERARTKPRHREILALKPALVSPPSTTPSSTPTQFRSGPLPQCSFIFQSKLTLSGINAYCTGAHELLARASSSSSKSHMKDRALIGSPSSVNETLKYKINIKQPLLTNCLSDT